jgi:hypothetical protein
MHLSELTADFLRPFVGDRFTVSSPDGKSAELTLTDVIVVMEKHVSTQLKRDSFALYFSGPENVRVNQGTYAMTHPSMGEITIFLVPKRRLDNGAYEVEAIFT